MNSLSFLVFLMVPNIINCLKRIFNKVDFELEGQV